MKEFSFAPALESVSAVGTEVWSALSEPLTRGGLADDRLPGAVPRAEGMLLGQASSFRAVGHRRWRDQSLEVCFDDVAAKTKRSEGRPPSDVVLASI